MNKQQKTLILIILVLLILSNLYPPSFFSQDHLSDLKPGNGLSISIPYLDEIESTILPRFELKDESLNLPLVPIFFITVLMFALSRLFALRAETIPEHDTREILKRKVVHLTNGANSK